LNYYVPPKAHYRGLFGHNTNYATASLRITGAIGYIRSPTEWPTAERIDAYLIITGGLATNNFGAAYDHSGSHVARRYMAITHSGLGGAELSTCRSGCNSSALHTLGYVVASDIVGFNANGTPLTTAQSLSQSISSFQHGRLSCSIDVVNPDNNVTITLHQLWGGSEFNGLEIFASNEAKSGSAGKAWRGTVPVPRSPGHGVTNRLPFNGGMGATYDPFNRGAVSGGAWADGTQGVNPHPGLYNLGKNSAIGLPLVKFDRKYSGSFTKIGSNVVQNTADKDFLLNGHRIYYINNGIVSNPIINTTASTLDVDGMPQRNQGVVADTTDYHGLGHPFCQLNAYQPFSLAALSSWPLSVREDIFGTINSFNARETNEQYLIEFGEVLKQNYKQHYYKILTHTKTPYLTSSVGGKGIMIGLSPHTLTASTEQLLDLAFGTSKEHHRLDYGPYSTDLMANHIRSGHVTRSVGDLVYSTKPSIFFYRRHSQEGNYDSDEHPLGLTSGINTEGGLGYLHPSASLQFNRHTYPYQTPFYATDRIVNRAPFFDSYADFIGNDLKLLGREYSIVPEFKLSEHLDDYTDFMSNYRNQAFGAGHGEGGFPVHIKKTIANYAVLPELSELPEQPVASNNTYVDLSSNERTIYGPAAGLPVKHRSNFMLLHGADITSSAYNADFHFVDNTGLDQSTNKTIYEWNPLSGSVSKQRQENVNAYGKYKYTYKVDPLSVEFYAKYSETENLSKLKAMLGAVQKGDEIAKHVPEIISFDVKGIKKLLPYSGFYPAVRTTQIGYHLSKAFESDLSSHEFANARLGHRDDDGQLVPEATSVMGTKKRFKDYGIFNDFGNKLAVPYGQLDPNDLSTTKAAPVGEAIRRITEIQKRAKLQSFIEPLMAPGLLYNSIKSGMGVDYPIYTSPPKVFAPLAFTGSWITQSFDYGGGYMMGAARAFPSVLTSMPRVRMPFEALYNFNVLKATFKSAESYVDPAAATLSTTVFDSFRSSYLVPDFVDYDLIPTSSMFYRGGGAGHAKDDQASKPLIEAVGRQKILHGLTASYVYTPNAGVKESLEYSTQKENYYSAINNFLAETMNFYLRDIDSKVMGVKFPIVISQTDRSIRKFDGVGVGLTALQKKEYAMGVSLKMGKEQVMCEGPRNSGFAKRTVEYDKWVWGRNDPASPDYDSDDIIITQSIAPTRYQQTSSIRGYIYGPPIEIVHHELGETYFTDNADEPSETGETILQNRIRWDDYASYFAANLQDPAYQAFTPPYFYGESTLIVRFNNSGFDTFGNIEGVGAEVVTDADIHTIRSRAVSDGVTGSYNYERYDLGLCTSLPSTSSVSVGATNRMKLKNCMEIFGSFPVQCKIGAGFWPGDAGTGVDPGTWKIAEYDFWYMQPKWIAPVLNFFHTSSYYRPTTSDPSFENHAWNSVLGQDNPEWTGIPGLPTQHTASNPYHDETTGRGMWGGYGTCPYDGKLEEVLYPEGFKSGQGHIDDGIFLNIHEVSMLSNAEAVEQAGQFKDQVIGYGSTGLHSNTGYYSALDQFLGDVTATGEVAGDKQFLIGGSLIKDLDIFKSHEFEIGRVADKKDVSEAVVIIPYFEQPVIIKPKMFKPQPGATGGSGVSNLRNPNHALSGEIYTTREIIPGKYFLPIHSRTFQNILSTILVNTYELSEDQRINILGGERYQSATYATQVAQGNLSPETVEKDTAPEHNLEQALATDCGKMINLLLGDSPFFDRNLGRNWRTGYQLPPEFDFINNSAVEPFQMMVVPFQHTLSKEDLVNIYQGIMPDPSLRAEHVNSSFSANPGAPSIVNDRLFPTYALTRHEGTAPTETQVGYYNLSSFDNGNFLRPYHISTSGDNLALVSDQFSRIPAWTSRDFYENLRFMVFKVKQRSVKNFEKYKKRQLLTVMSDRLKEIDGAMSYVYDNKLRETLYRDEIYGSNWPYDYFSLIEAIKIDVNVKL
jgi:hypothetical protein